ncbi:alpha-1,2-fucosyltransferase [Methylobacterium phyllosphaerae]
MIIVQLVGGLGNQLFQYAAGYALSKKNNKVLKFDRSVYTTYRLHNFALGNLRIEASEASNDEIELLSNSGKTFLERGLEYDERFNQPFDRCIMKGYWQSERYFADFRSQLLSQFRPIADSDDPRDRATNDSIDNHISVAVHIRRADYVTDQNANAVHGVLSSNYYKEARDLILNKLNRNQRDSAHWFIFSDDPTWVKDNLTWFGPMTVIEHNGPERNYRDIELMSKCRHHIIANSSFSWWGAWLSTHRDQIVIAPRRWFADTCLQSKDIVPSRWIKL